MNDFVFGSKFAINYLLAFECKSYARQASSCGVTRLDGRREVWNRVLFEGVLVALDCTSMSLRSNLPWLENVDRGRREMVMGSESAQTTKFSTPLVALVDWSPDHSQTFCPIWFE
jgi:hypothetical protein